MVIVVPQLQVQLMLMLLLLLLPAADVYWKSPIVQRSVSNCCCGSICASRSSPWCPASGNGIRVGIGILPWPHVQPPMFVHGAAAAAAFGLSAAAAAAASAACWLGFLCVCSVYAACLANNSNNNSIDRSWSCAHVHTKRFMFAFNLRSPPWQRFFCLPRTMPRGKKSVLS